MCATAKVIFVSCIWILALATGPQQNSQKLPKFEEFLLTTAVDQGNITACAQRLAAVDSRRGFLLCRTERSPSIGTLIESLAVNADL